MWNASINCPCCSKQIPWKHRRKMTNIFGTRKSAPCPYCGILITYSKSNRMFLIGSWFILLLAILGLLLEVLKIYEGFISSTVYWFLWLLFLLLRIPLITVKLEISDLEEKNESK